VPPLFLGKEFFNYRHTAYSLTTGAQVSTACVASGEGELAPPVRPAPAGPQAQGFS